MTLQVATWPTSLADRCYATPPLGGTTARPFRDDAAGNGIDSSGPHAPPIATNMQNTPTRHMMSLLLSETLAVRHELCDATTATMHLATNAQDLERGQQHQTTMAKQRFREIDAQQQRYVMEQKLWLRECTCPSSSGGHWMANRSRRFAISL